MLDRPRCLKQNMRPMFQKLVEYYDYNAFLNECEENQDKGETYGKLDFELHQRTTKITNISDCNTIQSKHDGMFRSSYKRTLIIALLVTEPKIYQYDLRLLFRKILSAMGIKRGSIPVRIVKFIDRIPIEGFMMKPLSKCKSAELGAHLIALFREEEQ